jgi:hypothetical protein
MRIRKYFWLVWIIISYDIKNKNKTTFYYILVVSYLQCKEQFKIEVVLI